MNHNQFACQVCGSKFTHKKNLYKHERKFHGTATNQVVGTIKCPGCETKVLRMMDLLDHVTQKHGSVMDTYHMTFYSAAEFESWLKNEEKENDCRFVRRTAAKGAITYLCNRSGFANPKSVLERKRKVKKNGTCKIGGMCTAYISRKEENGIISAFYCRSHFGHQHDLRYLPLTKDEKNIIAGKLLQGVPVERVLRDMQCTEPHQKIKRINLTDRQDVRNICKKYGVPFKADACTQEETEIHQEQEGFSEGEVADEIPIIFQAVDEISGRVIRKGKAELQRMCTEISQTCADVSRVCTEVSNVYEGEDSYPTEILNDVMTHLSASLLKLTQLKKQAMSKLHPKTNEKGSNKVVQQKSFKSVKKKSSKQQAVLKKGRNDEKMQQKPAEKVLSHYSIST